MALKGKVLLVDDDAALRDILQSTLELEDYEVVAAEDGSVAKQKLDQLGSEISVIITDIRMPNADGVEVLKHAKGKRKDLPVILMTGIAEIIQTKKAVDLGCDDFIAKPFKPSELLAALDILLNPDNQTLNETNSELGRDPEFCKVWLEDFVTGSSLQTDLYVRLSSTKYLKVARNGSSLDRPRVEAYRQRGLHYLYIPKEDFAKYVGLNLKVTTAIAKSGGGISKSQKMQLLKHTTEVILEETNVNGVSPELVEVAQTLVGSTVAMMTEDDDLYSLLSMLNTHSDALYAHSMAVSVYSALIAQKMQWTSLGTKSKLVMAGLFHDIGKKELPRQLLEKPRINLSDQEVKILETHVVRGKNILLQMPSIPSDVVLAVSQHHEYCNGQGFPGALTVHKIHPLAKVICVANLFANLVVKGLQGREPLTPKAAIQELVEYHLEEVDRHALAGLMNAFGFEVPKEFEKYGQGKLGLTGT
ncbi:MAG: response regulator [Bdellovibrionales bacterium]|nr:response regulator [Bdellovibrionales bacterium]